MGVYQRFFKEKGLNSISFAADSGITTIHNQAFRNNNITRVVLPPDLQEIHWGAFADNELIEITIGSGVTIANDNSLGVHGAAFRQLYASPEGGEGTYSWNGSEWAKN